MYFLIVGYFTFFSAKSTAQCTTCTNNLVTNGGFDSNTTSWTSSNGDFTSANIYPQCGTTRHAMIKWTSGIAQFYQDFTGFTAGANYQLTFWGGVHVSSFNAEFGVEFYNSATPSAGSLISQSKVQVDKILGGSPNMQFYTLSFTVPAGTVKIRARGSTNGDWLKVDEVCIKNPTPVNVCNTESVNNICTPPSTWNVNVVASGNVDWQTLTGVVPDNVTVKIRVSGTGTVTIKNKNLSLTSAAAVVFFDGPTLVIDNGSLLLPTAGARYIQNCGAFMVTGGVIQNANTGVCITNAIVEIGQEKAGPKFTSGSVYTSASFQNDGGYRYLEGNCINVTNSFILKVTGTGTATNGVDLIRSCFIEVGDAGSKHALVTPVGSADSEDAGNWDCNNTQSIFNSTIILANGNYVRANKTSTFCNSNVKVNRNGNFHVNSGNVQGDGFRVVIENDFGNCGNWTVTNVLWSSTLKNTTNVPGTGAKSNMQTLVNTYFSQGCSVSGCSTPVNNPSSCPENQMITFTAGAYIINMGVTPQTVNNALKPYGMIYDLIKNYNVKVIWVINPSKVKDGVDFKYNNTDYNGGPFIIPSEYRTAAVNGRINYWQSLGVIGTTTVSELKLCPDFISRELKNVPRWTLDKQNGKLAVEYMINAGIPENAYGGNNGSGWKNPADLNCCDDLFVLPHADPVWSSHNRLLTWNLECKGGIWNGCHSGSALENMVNPSNRSVQTNFLSTKDPSLTGTSGNYANSNSLILWSNHKDGSPPYINRLPADPIAQYMGAMDGAFTNGSEQIFIPQQSAGTAARWNPSTKIIVYDPTQENVPTVQQDLRNAAAVLIYGRGFENSNRGYVMHSAGHSYDKGSSSPAHIAAQRAFFNFSWLVASDRAESLSMGSFPITANAGVATNLQVSLGNGANLSGFNIVWSSNCGGTFVPNAYTANAQYIPPSNIGLVPCVISVSITDPCGRTTTESRRVEVGCDYVVKPSVVNPTCNGNNNGNINLEITGASVNGSNSWNWVRSSPGGTGNGSGNTITALSPGTYFVTVTSLSGCSAVFTSLIEEPKSVALTATVTNYNCYGQTGSVKLTVTGGYTPYNYLWNNGATTSTRENLTAGTYTVTVSDASGCTKSASRQVTGPSQAINLTLTTTNISCNGQQNGTINSNVSNAALPLTFSWAGGVTTANRTGLANSSYMLTVTDATGCTAIGTASITQPTVLSASISVHQPTCPYEEGNVNDGDGAITLTVSGGTAPYNFLWSDGITIRDRTNLKEGNYSVSITDANSCQISKNIALNSTSTLPVTPAKINR